MKILITGSSGMVGRNLLEILYSNKYQILGPSKKELNLLDYKNTENFILKNKPDIIIHLAAIVGGIEANIKNSVKFLSENLIMNLNIINSANKAGVKNFLNIASSCIYPANIKKKLKVEMLLTGALEKTNEGYAISKIAGLKLCEYISKMDKNRNYKTIIPCNLYGKFDNFNNKSSHLIAAIIKKVHLAKNKNKNVEIWGTGKVRREFMFASDFAEFIKFSIINFEKLPIIMNLGTGVDYTVKQYYVIAAKILNYKGNFLFNKEKPEGIKRKLLDISVQKKIGWKNKTELKSGLYQTYNYFKKKYE